MNDTSYYQCSPSLKKRPGETCLSIGGMQRIAKIWNKLHPDDPIQIITLDLNEEDKTLYDILDNYVKLDKLDDNNKWKCDKCKKDVNPEKKNVFWNLSDTLIIQLKRYKRNGNVLRKINNFIKYPESLNMNKYNINYYNNSNNYELTSYSVQSGGMNFGHYYAVCKEGDKWIQYNDTHVNEIDKKTALSNTPYCLFYKRI